MLNARERFLFVESKKRFSKLERKFKKELETAHRELRQRKYVRGFLLKALPFQRTWLYKRFICLAFVLIRPV